MLELESEEWKSIKASPGGDGTLTARLLRQLSEGNEDAWAELHNQVCHQNSVGEVAFVAVPHLVRIARQAGPRLRALLLGTVGDIVASAATYPGSGGKPRDKWVSEYDVACADARSLAAETLGAGRLVATSPCSSSVRSPRCTGT